MTAAKNGNRKIWLLLGGLAVVIVVLAVIFFTGSEKESVKHFLDANLPKSKPSAPETAGTKTVTLFFLSDDDDLLHRESRDIAVGRSASDEAQRTLAELIKGSARTFVSPLPAEAKVRQVFVTKDGTAYVDFSREIMDKFSYGSSSELSAIYAVVNTLAFNFKAIKKVSILVEGAEKETLGGHVDLTHPFTPDFSLVAK